MKYSINEQERYTVIALHEENLNSILAPSLKSEFVILKDKGVINLILDLSDVKFVDSSGLSAILTGNRVFNDIGGVLVLTGVQHDSVVKLIAISRLDTILNIKPTEADAIDLIMTENLDEELEEDDEDEVVEA